MSLVLPYTHQQYDPPMNWVRGVKEPPLEGKIKNIYQLNDNVKKLSAKYLEKIKVYGVCFKLNTED